MPHTTAWAPCAASARSLAIGTPNVRGVGVPRRLLLVARPRANEATTLER